MYPISSDQWPLRILEEIYFWKTQEKEHTVVIRALLPNLEPAYVHLLAEWEKLFRHTQNAAQQLLDALHAPELEPSLIAKTQALASVSAKQSAQFIYQLQHLANQSQAVEANPTSRVVIAHIIRESEYFLRRLYPGYSAPNLEQRSELTGTQEGLWSPAADGGAVPIGGHTLPPLPYAYDSLEPYIDEATMRLHHDKHHLSYVKGLNKAELMLAELRNSGNYELIKHWEREAAFHGSGHYLHTIFWDVMAPHGKGKPVNDLAVQISQDFGSFEQFKQQFSQAAEQVEGSGWALLVWSPRSRRLQILQAEKHQNLTQWDTIPLLVLDVWEHSYYLKYKNERKKYIEAWWNVVNWDHVNERFAQARKLMWMPY
ncbi:MAG: superoxide dismutase [Paenibacillus sp. RIFOXYA1_FULL_44_5]|nr:MAG: superoxide dismutase [Paenibacillus sp. RIFOXYA1_FULL_44_5]